KLDRGDETVPSQADDVYADGRNGLELHNDYPRLYVRTYDETLQMVRSDDWVTMTRPGYAGSQSFGIYWGGDITGANNFGIAPGTDAGLRRALISLQRMAFMGFPNWGTDPGGYYQFKQTSLRAGSSSAPCARSWRSAGRCASATAPTVRTRRGTCRPSRTTIK